jgi:hypothetical protein
VYRQMDMGEYIGVWESGKLAKEKMSGFLMKVPRGLIRN